MTDLSRSCFALNKLNFSRCKALYKKKKERKLGTFSKLNTGLPNQESAGQMLEEVSHSGLNGKKMRNQMRRADRILSTLRSFLLSCESPQGREAPVQAAASLGEQTLMCFVFRQKGSLRCHALRTSRLLAHLRKRSKTAQLFRQTQVNIYTKAALPERRGSGQTRNQASRAPTELET